MEELKKALTENCKNKDSEEKWALQVKAYCQRLGHTKVLCL